jgi:hypothetical protein
MSRQFQQLQIIDNFPRGGCGDGRNFKPFLSGAHLFQCERIAINGRRRMSVACALIFLQYGNPRHFHGGGKNPLAQGGNLRVQIGIVSQPPVSMAQLWEVRPQIFFTIFISSRIHSS